MDTAAPFRPSRTQFWNDVVPAQVPMVWRNAAHDAPLVQLARRGTDALLDTLVSSAGHRPVNLAIAPPGSGGRLGYSPGRWSDWTERVSTLEGYVDELRRAEGDGDGEISYMQSAPVARAFPELAALMPLWLTEPATAPAPDAAGSVALGPEHLQLWIGTGGQRVAIHQDTSHGLLCMVSGRKDVFLFPPDQQANLYMASMEELVGSPWRSVVDVRRPDLLRFPRLAEAMRQCQHIVLEAGDVLFIPAHWWHAVDSHGLNVMYNYRWHDVSQARAEDLVAALAHGISVARAFPAESSAQLTELRDRLARIFDAGASPAEPATKARWVEALEPVRRGTSPGTPEPTAFRETKLELAPRVAATMGSDGVFLRNEATGGAGRLRWSFVPLMQCFSSPRSPSEIESMLGEAFELDPAALERQLRDLIAGGILVSSGGPPPALGPAAATVEALVAHVALAIADVPPHHRQALRRTLDLFAFQTHGDPWAHLDDDHRGLLGDPTHEPAKHALWELVVDSVRAHHALARLPDEAWDRPHRVDPSRVCTVDARGLTPDSPTPASLSWEQLEVLALFRVPTTPRSVLPELCEQWNARSEDVGELIAGWIASGTLVPVAA